jgi:hypothetical protein
MSQVLVDSSIWISFFRGAEESKILFQLLDSNQVCINNLILSELIPSLTHKKELTLAKLLYSVERLDIEIDWNEIIHMQTTNLKHGINRVGIPDLIIAQNAIQNQAKLLSFDKHFDLIKKHIGLKTYEIR